MDPTVGYTVCAYGMANCRVLWSFHLWGIHQILSVGAVLDVNEHQVNPVPYILNPKTQTLNPTHESQNTKHETRNTLS